MKKILKGENDICSFITDKLWKKFSIATWTIPKYDGDWVWGGTMFDISEMVLL